MFLRSNARSAGLSDRGQPMQATYVAALVVPPELASGALRCRHPAERELELLVNWRVRFAVEALGATDGPHLHQASTDEVRLQHERGTDWLLLAGAAPVSYSAFNAMLADIVQMGGVWTPPERRGRGYARSGVAGSLLAARTQGVAPAVLVAAPANEAAP